MIAAHSAVSRRLNDMQCTKDPVLMADLFDTITAAAGSYGCEVWSTPFLSGWHLRDCTLQRFQATMYKQALKLPCTHQQPAGVLGDGTVPYADTMAVTAAHAELLEQVGC